MNVVTECMTGGIAACGACMFSNPLEVVKTRMQLQGELQARGSYVVHYRNVFHAFYTIGKVDGVLALQKGLAPGLVYQFIMNGLRLGVYQVCTNLGLTKNRTGEISYFKCLLVGAASGCIGAFAGSPFYMIKTQLQAQANTSIAVGTQHNITSMYSSFESIFKQHGVKGLWRGTSAAVARVSVGSAVQLAAFSKCKVIILKKEVFPADSIMVPFGASMMAGVAAVLIMNPFDVVSTRVYNQDISVSGRGANYKNLGEAFTKIYQSEGLFGFYKGTGANYFRSGPHTILSLVFWDMLRSLMAS